MSYPNTILIILLILNLLVVLFMFFYTLLPYVYIERKNVFNLRFSTYITFFYFLFIILLITFNFLSYKYIPILLALFFISRVFIAIVRDIKHKKNRNKKLNEFYFFINVCLFAVILILYVIAFYFLFLQTISFGDGYITQNNIFYPIKKLEIFYISGFTFFSSTYNNLETQGLLTVFSLIEMFIAEIIIIMFIGILASALFDILKLKDLKNE